MQISLIALAALAATASANYNASVVYTTEVHTAYTTVCPAATELTFNGQTYTVTEVSCSQPGQETGNLQRNGNWEHLAARLDLQCQVPCSWIDTDTIYSPLP
jgi:hypothetical protein